jgi:hypothetical protein
MTLFIYFHVNAAFVNISTEMVFQQSEQKSVSIKLIMRFLQHFCTSNGLKILIQKLKLFTCVIIFVYFESVQHFVMFLKPI